MSPTPDAVPSPAGWERLLFPADYDTDARIGYYGPYGGSFVPEILHSTLEELVAVFDEARRDPTLWSQFVGVMNTYSCRPTPVTHLQRLSDRLGGAQIYLKREDLNHTGAHKINNVIGQGLLVQRMGKKRVIAETGAGQHGVATATMAARFGLECTIYMGAVDVERQRPNVFWMEQLGATVIPVEDGSATLKDAINECLRDWAFSMQDTHYALGTACGPHPFPQIVAWFQRLIGEEARRQMAQTVGLPDRVFACVGGGSNAMGMFLGFLDDEVELVGVEAGGEGLDTGRHAARLVGNDARPGIAQGYKTYFLQDEEGQMRHTHSVSAGLDYIGVSPILAHLGDEGRVRFEAATDEEVIAALRLLMETEGIIGALESTHAVAGAIREAPQMSPDSRILINLSGRGDKDIFTIADALGDEKWRSFLQRRGQEG
ncbi:MAG: tryptophan synthase subunit beta [Gemmatimonadetes bacterium]|nr:tryptophan synthase subunit beta [Gemmatimonadota bacterium]MBT5055811.1 tryptophan synthase subunit beta [Gemmatimonadota bacterium]MBT5143726.1 tryptophan synthase subunit beta [Gemmatimonadota bacterium]MBT5590493.1 tryptophan synthase subunit beta [Gemmatimonadota bacterium]MBT5965636.1 tryptophan synthase subunit beta [Gemmatimonadota bacterium]